MDTVNLSKSFTDMPTLKRLVPYGNVVVNSRREHDSRKVFKKRVGDSNSPEDKIIERVPSFG